tara:strand:- start:618 stop:1124 length:507 start_codon:yes stop_codon:yes gene_type:complete
MVLGSEGFLQKITNSFDNVMRIFSSRKWQLTILILVCVFAAAGVYAYRTYLKPKLKKDFVVNKEYIDGKDGYVDGIEIFYFYTKWCPHCKTTNPIWKEFIEDPMFSNGEYSGTSINFIAVDCDKDAGLADKYKVKGYPTIKLVKGDQIIEYDAKPSVDTLKQFVETSV